MGIKMQRINATTRDSIQQTMEKGVEDVGCSNWKNGTFEQRLPVASRSDQEISEILPKHNRQTSKSLDFIGIENILWDEWRAKVNTKRRTALDIKRRIEANELRQEEEEEEEEEEEDDDIYGWQLSKKIKLGEKHL